MRTGAAGLACERLAQLHHLPAAAIAHELGCSAGHVNVLLRQHGLACAPADRGRPAGIRFTVGPGQRAIMQQFRASSQLVSGLASAVGCPPARLFGELSGRVPMPAERVAAPGPPAHHVTPYPCANLPATATATTAS